jgi:hypothetical protein
VASKNGWYATAGSIIRIVAAVLKNSPTSAEGKNIMYNHNNTGSIGVKGTGYRGVYGIGINIGIYGEGIDSGVYGLGYAGVIGHGSGLDFYGDSGLPSRLLGPMYSKCGYLNGNNVLYSTVFNALSPVIPTVGNLIKISGGWRLDVSTFFVLSYAERTSSTEIVLYVIGSTIRSSVTVTAANGTDFYGLTIAWG